MTREPEALVVPTLSSERLTLEPLSRRHSAGMFALWREPSVCLHSGPASDAAGRPIALPAASPRESDRLLEFWLARREAGSGFRWAVVQRRDRAFLGAVGFNTLGRCAEYAYHFVPAHQGVGHAAEASRLAIDWVLASGSEAVEAFIEDANERSRRLVERLGFRPAVGAEDTPRYELRASDWGESGFASDTMSSPSSA